MRRIKKKKQIIERLEKEIDTRRERERERERELRERLTETERRVKERENRLREAEKDIGDSGHAEVFSSNSLIIKTSDCKY